MECLGGIGRRPIYYLPFIIQALFIIVHSRLYKSDIPFSSVPGLKTFYRLYFYSCEPVIKYWKIIFQGIQSIYIIKVHTSHSCVIRNKSIDKYAD